MLCRCKVPDEKFASPYPTVVLHLKENAMQPAGADQRSAAPNPPIFNSQRILITGANGMIGHALRAAAQARGIEAVPVQRPLRGDGAEAAPAGTDTILWEPEATQPFADLGSLEGFDVVIHLAGANLAAKRWSAAYKKVILNSRTQPTGALALALARLKHPPRLLLSASATGFYGSRTDEVLTEQSGLGTGFLSEVCQAWENATAPAVSAGIRVAHLRFGVVLTPFGGALRQMLPLFRLGFGGKLGSGKQWTSWITLKDLLEAVFHIMADEQASGPYNVVAPAPVRNIDFTRALGAALHRPAVLPAPAFALRAAFGQMADEALLTSCRVLPERLEASGFQFGTPEIGAALESLLGRPGPA